MAKKLKKKIRVKSLNPRYNTRVRSEFLDYDYLKDLNEEELLWLAQFTDEYVGGAIEKTKAGKVRAGHLHNTNELAKQCYDSNNRRNNDVYGVSRANNLAYDIENELGKSDGWYITNPEYTELSIISKLSSNEKEEEMPVIEYFKCRDRFLDDRRKELDAHYMSKYDICEDDYFTLITLYEFKLISSKKALNFLSDKSLLEKFIQDTKLFQT